MKGKSSLLSHQEHIARTALWLRTYEQQISKREELIHTQLSLYKMYLGKNHKSLVRECKKEHVWVPATHFWIYVNHSIRSFHEAKPFKIEDFAVLPQICWNCCCTREKLSRSWKERLSLSQQIASDNTPKKKSKRRRATPKDTSNVATDLSALGL